MHHWFRVSDHCFGPSWHSVSLLISLPLISLMTFLCVFFSSKLNHPFIPFSCYASSLSSGDQSRFISSWVFSHLPGTMEQSSMVRPSEHLNTSSQNSWWLQDILRLVSWPGHSCQVSRIWAHHPLNCQPHSSDRAAGQPVGGLLLCWGEIHEEALFLAWCIRS